ncbi:MAG: family 10 glycosylhydrolase [Candidatus Omnitrophica bacterium]|nr:family 10 glycosylhydrolase [Candidatus Omnitrophota bacterium]
MKIHSLFLALLFLLPAIGNASEPSRGIFIWSFEEKPVLSSETKIHEAIVFAKQHGIKTIFVQVYRSNKSWFASKVADATPFYECLKSVGQDPLSLLIKEAHRQDINVHAWLNMMSLGGNKDARILKKYGPGILTRNVQKKRRLEDYKIDNQFFLEPSDPRVHQELLTIVGELLHTYPTLDGIQFDYIRYPDVHPFYGYSPDNIRRFKKELGVKQIVEENPAWKQWKRDAVTHLLEDLVVKVRLISPRIHISTTGSLAYTRAYEEALQDWPSWVNHDLVEFVTLMNYPPDAATFAKNIIEIKPHVKGFSKVNVAVGTYKPDQTEQDFKAQWEYCELSEARACVVFHYDSLIQKPALSEFLKKSQ